MNTKYYNVQAKCGHVGRNHYILKWFYVKALTGEEAAKVVRDKPRVKHDQTYIPLLQNWKLNSYEQYLEFIDHKETERLNDIVNLRDKNPLEYYKKLVERGYK